MRIFIWTVLVHADRCEQREVSSAEIQTSSNPQSPLRHISALVSLF